MYFRRSVTRSVVMVTALMAGLLLALVVTGSARAIDSNQVEFWCETGIKVEPIDTASFTVPPPPAGSTWTLLVLKSGTDNQEFPNPIPGQSYTPSRNTKISTCSPTSEVEVPPANHQLAASVRSSTRLDDEPPHVRQEDMR